MARLRVVLVEDEDLFRSMLADAISQDPQLEVAGAFAGGSAALQASFDPPPDVALLDIVLEGGMNGVELGIALRARYPGIGVVLLSNHRNPAYLTALDPNASSGWSYLCKRTVRDVETVRRTIQGTALGLVVLDSELLASLRPRENSRISRLPPRRYELLQEIARGYTNAGIAANLGISVKTVENQINLLYRDLGIDTGNSAIQPRVRAVRLFLDETRTTEVS
ncbi:MAG: response regulator transcription factor [Thermaerobacter sp.]|nr:response regulator transcription factor [Thermaerobacter sp.]